MKKINELKKHYVEYFEDVPVQRYAAEYIGRDEDTIIRWKKQDRQFAESIQRAKAIWIRKVFVKTKAEFALEKLEAEVFNKSAIPSEQPRYNVGIRDEKGQEILRKHTDFMLEITKSTTSKSQRAKLRNAKDYK